jgi:hypothetical protein
MVPVLTPRIRGGTDIMGRAIQTGVQGEISRRSRGSSMGSLVDGNSANSSTLNSTTCPLSAESTPRPHLPLRPDRRVLGKTSSASSSRPSRPKTSPACPMRVRFQRRSRIIPQDLHHREDIVPVQHPRARALIWATRYAPMGTRCPVRPSRAGGEGAAVRLHTARHPRREQRRGHRLLLGSTSGKGRMRRRLRRV